MLHDTVTISRESLVRQNMGKYGNFSLTAL
jgi:hypothetical protein